MLRVLRRIFFCVCLGVAAHARASGGYDIGSAVGGLGRVELDFTWNPFDIIPYGQSYVVWKLGLTQRLDIHGYYSHEAGGTDQNYFGVFYQFFASKRLDMATAMGGRVRLGQWDYLFPQFLWDLKLESKKGYSIGGSEVIITKPGVTGSLEYSGMTHDVAFFVPLTKFMKLGIGFFYPLSGKWYPTYSLDVRFY